MDTATFLALFWGWLMLIICTIFLFSKKTFTTEMFKLVNDKGFALLSGYISLSLGLVTIILHNIWAYDWSLVVTIFGWLALIKGVARIGLPGLPSRSVAYFKEKELLARLLFVVMIVLSLFLIMSVTS